MSKLILFVGGKRHGTREAVTDDYKDPRYEPRNWLGHEVWVPRVMRDHEALDLVLTELYGKGRQPEDMEA